MMRKVSRCSSCGKPTMCVSHDNMRFYCNRCLGAIQHANKYVYNANTTEEKKPNE